MSCASKRASPLLIDRVMRLLAHWLPSNRMGLTVTQCLAFGLIFSISSSVRRSVSSISHVRWHPAYSISLGPAFSVVVVDSAKFASANFFLRCDRSTVIFDRDLVMFRSFSSRTRHLTSYFTHIRMTLGKERKTADVCMFFYFGV